MLLECDVDCTHCAGLWMSEESVGDAGANNLGYFTGCFSPQGTSILAHGFTGALHLWKRPGQPLPSVTFTPPIIPVAPFRYPLIALSHLTCCL